MSIPVRTYYRDGITDHLVEVAGELFGHVFYYPRPSEYHVGVGQGMQMLATNKFLDSYEEVSITEARVMSPDGPKTIRVISTPVRTEEKE